MDDDQNYSVVSSFICRLCCKDIDQKKYRYLVEGKKEFNVLAELEDLPFTLKLNNSRRYICKPCLEKLKKRRILIKRQTDLESDLYNLNSGADEKPFKENLIKVTPSKRLTFAEENEAGSPRKKLCSVVTSTPARSKSISEQCHLSPIQAPVFSCKLCFKVIEKQFDKYLAESKEFNAVLEIQTLPFCPRENNSRYICKVCRAKLKKHRELVGKQSELEKEILIVNSGASEEQSCGVSDQETPLVSEVEPLGAQTEIEEKTKHPDVSVKVCWPSKEVNKKLPEDLESLGKMLVCGTYKQMANAIWKNEQLKKELVEYLKKDIERECSELCSKKKPSILRKTHKEDMLELTMEKVDGELKERAPLLHTVLSAACVNPLSRAKSSQNNFAPLAMAAAICLRHRSKFMIAIQLLITNFLYHSNWLATLARLSSLRLTTSHTFLYKKLDDYGKDYNAKICDAVSSHSQFMARSKSCQSDNASKSLGNQSTAGQDGGRKLVFDNLDYNHEVHYMTEEHQNVDCHFVTAMCTENRVPAVHLSYKQPDRGILEMENGKCLPSITENVKQRENYILLVQRIIVNNIPCLRNLADVSPTHIPHAYSQEMKIKSETTFLGIIYENENDADGILRVLKELHSYVPFHGEGCEQVYAEQGVVGDQLSVERAVNGHNGIANGFTPEDRLDGLHFEIADWHAGNKFLEVAFANLYSGASAGDKCTLYSDRNLINRRNVKGDVTGAVNACRRFFELEVKSRVIAAALHLLGLGSLDDERPKQNMPPPADATREAKKGYLRRLAAVVVDTFVIDQLRNQAVRESVLVMQCQQEVRQEDVTPEGRYKCRAPCCDKTFAHDGKLRRDHEAQHNPPVIVEQPATTFIMNSPVNPGERDDMLSYQKALLDYGMLLINFWDAISEGDGERTIRCWKFFLMYLKKQGGSAKKYALEALYLLFQVYALLSPQEAHRLVWNRTVKNKPGVGGNIPLDLDLEFKNKFVKEAIKKLGPSATRKSMDRICHSLGVTCELMTNFDNNLSVFKRSGRHVQRSSKGDLAKIVACLDANKAFTHSPGRKYNHFSNMKSSILDGFDLQKMFAWIQEHKLHMILHRRAR